MHVGGAEGIACEPFGLRQFALDVTEVQFQLRIDETVLHGLRDPARDRLDEERHARAADAQRHQLEQQRRHGRAFGVVHPVVVAKAFRRVPCGGAKLPLPITLVQILDDRAGFRERLAVVRDDRRLAQRMHGAQLGRREHGVGIALIALDFVLDAQFFEHPEHALRTGIVEMVNDEHG